MNRFDKITDAGAAMRGEAARADAGRVEASHRSRICGKIHKPYHIVKCSGKKNTTQCR